MSHILEQLGLNNTELYLRNVEHFTEKEGVQRDKIVEDYFGKDGLQDLIEILSNTISDHISKVQFNLLDLGAGSGTFLVPIARKQKLHKVFALDATPLMLQIAERKLLGYEIECISIIGDMEQIRKSIKLNKSASKSIPEKFDVVVSTLALHHVADTQKVLEETSHILKNNGVAIFVDAVLSSTSGMTASEEHAHDGFNIDDLIKKANLYFEEASISILDIKCTDSITDEGTDQFIMILKK